MDDADHLKLHQRLSCFCWLVSNIKKNFTYLITKYLLKIANFSNPIFICGPLSDEGNAIGISARYLVSDKQSHLDTRAF